MPRITSYSLNPKDEPILQQLETYLQHLSQDKKAAIVIAALYEATEPSAVDFDHVCEALRARLRYRLTPRPIQTRTVSRC